MDRKKIGIVGGMGSVAAAYFFKRFVELNKTRSDQEYIESFLHNNTQIPDRIQAIIYRGENPIPEMQRSIELLNSLGVDFIIFACITAHYFIPKLQQFSHAKIINGITETIKYIETQHPDLKKVGLLASTGTIRIKIYHNILKKKGIETVTLESKDQEKYVMESIYEDWGIKAGEINGEPEVRLLKAVDLLAEAGAEAIILGCSELPLVLNQKKTNVQLIDSIDILLKASINNCLNSPSQ